MLGHYKTTYFSFLKITLFSVFIISCSGNPGTDNAPNPLPEKLPDCSRIAAAYTNCIDLPDTSSEFQKSNWLKEFKILCHTKKDWKNRMIMMEKCLKKSEQCLPFMDCVNKLQAEYEWKSAQTVKITNTPGDINIGTGKTRVTVFVDASREKCIFILKTLAKLQEEIPVFTLNLKPVVHQGTEGAEITSYLAMELGKRNHAEQLSFISGFNRKMDISGFKADGSVRKNLRLNTEFLENSVINSLPVIVISEKSFEGIKSKELYKNLIKISSQSYGAK